MTKEQFEREKSYQTTMPHIAPAEEKGIEQLERQIERSIRNG